MTENKKKYPAAERLNNYGEHTGVWWIFCSVTCCELAKRYDTQLGPRFEAAPMSQTPRQCGYCAKPLVE